MSHYLPSPTGGAPFASHAAGFGHSQLWTRAPRATRKPGFQGAGDTSRLRARAG
jgi:hypothetical protein